MASLPQLVEEDVQEIDAALRDFLAQSEATAVMITAEGGFVIFQHGDTSQFEPTLLGALAANVFSATQAIAKLLDECSFSTVYQQGVKFSLLIGQVNKYHTLVVIFPAEVSVGAVRYFAAFAIQAIAAQLSKAKERAPGEGFDLAMLNIADATGIFRRKEA